MNNCNAEIISLTPIYTTISGGFSGYILLFNEARGDSGKGEVKYLYPK